MDINRMLEELRREREAIEQAILTLERLANGQGKRRGRPPAWMRELRDRQIEEPVATIVTARKGRARKAAEPAA